MIINAKKIFVPFVIILSVILFSALPCKALREETHKAINKYIADKNASIAGSALHQYLQKQLGMQKGLEEFVNNKMIFEWIGDGGVNEDAGIRSLNHFLNPINNQGLLGNYSALQWATLPVGAQPLSPISSWNDVRYYYYLALTSKDKTTRDDNFAMTFQGVGQVMHLVEDMSVPAHTRNESHLFGDGYEGWFLKPTTPAISSYSTQYFTPSDLSFLIPNLFDTDQYNGTNPGITTSSNSTGLAEYTNANFLSAGTIFTKFTYPAYSPSDMNPKTDERDANGKQILYLSKSAANGAAITHFARAGIFYNYLPPNYQSLELTLDDDQIYGDYAQLLIPRAIGYSSQVLSYFFRGQMEVKDMPVFDDQNQKLKQLYLKVRNTTLTKETMFGNGQSSCFMLSWHYTPSGGGSDIWGKFPTCISLPKDLPYGLDDNGNPLVSDNVNDDIYTTTIVFGNLDQIQNAAPILKTDYLLVEFTLTYLGSLGDEKMLPSNTPGQVIISGAVVGKQFQPAGSILFDEEWMTSPKGDNSWYMSHDSAGNNTDTTFCDDADPTGMATTGIDPGNSGGLIMNNTRYAVPNCDPSVDMSPGHCNVSLIGNNSTSGNTYNQDSTGNYIFPINITNNTYIQFSLDAMSISPTPPESDYALAYQILEFQFNHGYVLQFFVGDQGIYNYNPYVGYFTFDLGYTIVGNIYELFAEWGYPTPPSDLQLNQIKISQQTLWNLPCNTQYTQTMAVDFIRVGELKSTD